MPSTLTTLGEAAFKQCSSLTTLVLSRSNVATIPTRAFEECSSLTSVYLSTNCTTIGYFAFGKCSSITYVDHMESVTSIDQYAFSNCKSLSSIRVGSQTSSTSIGSFAFSGCNSLTYVQIYIYRDNTPMTVSARAFADCYSLKHISFGDNRKAAAVTQFGDGAFLNCFNLESLTIPYLGTSVDSPCTLEYLIGSTAKKTIQYVVLTDPGSIANNAFYECTNLLSITFSSSGTVNAFLAVDLSRLPVTLSNVELSATGILYTPCAPSMTRPVCAGTV